MKKDNPLIVISGPTATGKTSISIEIAEKINGEVINFDSLLFYREINIGTAKPSKAEMKDIPHHMIDTHSIYAPINAADYARETVPIINEIHARDRVPILTGGSGFYLQALLKGMFDSQTTPHEITKKSDLLFQKEGIAPFRLFLQEHDSESFDRYHKNDHYRIRRAVEHYWTTGTTFSESRKKMDKKSDISPAKKFNWSILHIYSDIPKDTHFDIIQQRTKMMLNNGLLDEVRSLLDSGATGNEKPLNSIGYKESIAFLAGEYASKTDLEEAINIHTRQLAKSQRTWFKKQDKLSFNPIEERELIFKACKEFIKVGQ